VTQTEGWKEWADYWLGLQNFCERGCLACFATWFDIKYKRITDPKERLTFKPRKTIENPDKKYPGRVAFPNTHDITIQNYSQCEEYLIRLLKAGNQVLIVTKPDENIIRLLISALSEFKEQLEFRLSISTYDNEVLKKFEPNASDFEERVLCLKMLFMAGFETSVSAEYYLTRDVKGLIKRIYPYVTREIWVGIMNHFDQIVEYAPVIESLRELYSLETVLTIHSELERYFGHNYFTGKITIKYKDTFEAMVNKNNFFERNELIVNSLLVEKNGVGN